MRVTRGLRIAVILTVLSALGGCSPAQVSLGSVTYPATAPLQPHQPATATPNGACPGSLSTAQSGPDIYGAWWEVRDDSSAILMVGRSTDSGKSWAITAQADTSDHSLRGCTRPPPAVAADSTTNYVDIAYFMDAREGPGVFFTHSMDARKLGTGDGIFHSPVPVVYGDQPSEVSVAAKGDELVVAYEDPNGEREVVGLALSSTMGHIFEQRLIVSQPETPARAPIVAIRGDSVIVQWMERPDSVTTGGRVAVRTARW
ncbi:MAG: hypothetical protein ABI026_03370 [Gemmatimonadaceae bacterium]